MIGLFLIMLMVFGAGAGYLMGSLVSAGQLDADSVMTAAFVPLALLILAFLVYEIRMLTGWIALSRKKGV